MKRRRSGAHVTEDDDAPLTAAELKKLRPVSFAKRVRHELGLSQVEFADRYGIALGTLRDWEQRKTKPDQAAMTLLRVIHTSPKTVERAVKDAEAA